MEAAPGTVLDASALLAYLKGEPGNKVVEEALSAGAFMSIVNYAEVLCKLADAGEDPASGHGALYDRGLIGGLVELVTFTEDDAIASAQLRLATRDQGLSLADRCCLATGLRLGRPVLTADRTWASVQAGTTIRLIRT
jgi:ribonuclease VapC